MRHIDASEALGCADLTIITHDEEAVLTERGKTVKVVPAWKWLLNRRQEDTRELSAGQLIYG